MEAVALKAMFLGFFFGMTFATASSSILPDPKLSVACRDQVESKIKNWTSQPDWQAVASSSEDLKTFKSPTSKIGAWVYLSTSASESVLTQIARSKQTVFVYKTPRCRAKTEIRTDAAKLEGPYFTDEDLLSLLTASKQNSTRGIIYVWSPSMPYSVVGVSEILEFARARKMPITVLMDPNANYETVTEAVNENSFSSRETKRLESIELLERGARIHYPSMLLYKNGKLLTWAIPGYNQGAKLSRIVDAFLK